MARSLNILRSIMMLLLASFVISGVEATPIDIDQTIVIQSDGTITPSNAPINRNGNVYTFVNEITMKGEVSQGIEVERNDIIIDGAGNSIRGQGNLDGIYISGNLNITIRNLIVTSFYYGIDLNSSQNCIIQNCNISQNDYFGIRLTLSDNNIITNNVVKENINDGVSLDSCRNITVQNNDLVGNDAGVSLSSCTANTVSGNTVRSNAAGIDIWASTNQTTVTGNTISGNGYGISFYNATDNTVFSNEITSSEISINVEFSSNNHIYHNNFKNASSTHVSTLESANTWDDGYPSSGNYWDNYTGRDANSDGIGDTPYFIDQNNVDHYPLMTQYDIPEYSVFMLTIMTSIISLMIAKRKQTSNKT